MKTILPLQMLFFLAFGLVSGASISELYDYKITQMQQQAMVKVLLSVSMNSLGDIKIKRGDI